MSRRAPRQLGLAVAVAALTVGVAGTGLTGRTGWSLTALGVLVAVACLLLLDVRHRQQIDRQSVRRLEAAIGSMGDSTTRELVGLRGLTEESAVVLDELTNAGRVRDEETARRLTRLDVALAHLDIEPVNEVQALLQLLPKVPGAPPLPGVGGWALSASSLLGLWDVVERERPSTIVECGSGTSTLWLCYAARAVGHVRVISLEHKGAHARRTQALLARHGVEYLAQVRHARMREVNVDGEALHWYDVDCLEDVGSIDLLLVDGPPQSSGPLARFPAVPLLADRLAPGALIVVDDADRPGEQQAIARWVEHYGFGVERRLSRDAVLLRRR